jgi:hypothetical protein
MPDPWEEAAKNFKGAPKEGNAPAATSASNDDWKVWQQPGATEASKPSRLETIRKGIDKASETEPIAGIKSAANDLGAGTTRVMLNPFAHPLQTLKGVANSMGAAMGNPDAINNVARSGADFVNQFRQNPGGESVAAVPQAVMAAAGGGEAEAIPEATGESALQRMNLRPAPSESIVPPSEMAARKLSQAVLPATKDASGFIKAADKEVPNVLDYARQQGNPLKTQLEFSKAAGGHAQNVRDFYENQVLGPNDRLVETTGTGFGQQTGEGPKTYAKLSEIDKRITSINKQLDAPTLNTDDARRALATKEGLQNEASSLRPILHQHLGEATGLAPDAIENLRQRVGRSYELANDTDAAVTQRMQGEGRSRLGELPLSKLPARLLETLRGGPTAIADRGFQRAIKDYPGQPEPLPTINPQGRADQFVQAQREQDLLAPARSAQNAARTLRK